MDTFTDDQSLYQAYASACRDRDAALAEAERWRQVYQIEAQQRRTEAKAAQHQIALLQSELAQLQQQPLALKGASPAVDQSANRTNGSSPELQQLQQRLSRLQADCDRLKEALHQEQTNHAKTRVNLTGALGDAIALVRKYRP